MAFLDAKQYLGWAKEVAYHRSSGPHGDGVRVFYSPKAAAAVKSGALTLPAGAATVKELSSGGSLYGWAVWVKVQGATGNGNGFYWLESIHQGGGTNPSSNTQPAAPQHPGTSGVSREALQTIAYVNDPPANPPQISRQNAHLQTPFSLT